ncbi:MAG TPA: hypothetical protein VNU25_00465 [Candidatus Paceibacterota bacterium]|nr:hypothetical protein [Candidatus Paceibacterota bacterium]
MSLSSKLAGLLSKADLPQEAECLGKVFAFTWTNAEGVEHRVTGRIDGISIISDESDSLHIISASLPRRREHAVSPPSLSFNEADGWYIYFADLEHFEQSSDSPVIFYGTFELL